MAFYVQIGTSPAFVILVPSSCSAAVLRRATSDPRSSIYEDGPDQHLTRTQRDSSVVIASRPRTSYFLPSGDKHMSLTSSRCLLVTVIHSLAACGTKNVRYTTSVLVSDSVEGARRVESHRLAAHAWPGNSKQARSERQPARIYRVRNGEKNRWKYSTEGRPTFVSVRRRLR